MSSNVASAAPACDRSPIFSYSQAVYASQFNLAQSFVGRIRAEHSVEMADFLQQVLLYMRGYENGQSREKNEALEKIDTLIDQLPASQDLNASLQQRLNAGNIMMHAARIHLLSSNALRSAQLAKAAYQLLDKVLVESPEQADAYLSAGLYLYFAANENNAWGWVKRLLSLQGDKQRGRELVELAVMKSPDFAFEAARSLTMDMNWDYPDVCRYLGLYEPLDAQEIKTIEHRQRHIAAQLFCGQSELAMLEIEEINALMHERALTLSAEQSRWLFEARLQAMATAGQVDELRHLLSLNQDQANGERELIEFSLARALDVEGLRSPAKQLYQQLTRSNLDERYRHLATKYLENAYQVPTAYVLPSQNPMQFACKD